MAHYPASATGLAYATYPVGPTAAAQQVTSGGTAHTKGSYVQLIASLGLTANHVTVVGTRATAAARAWMFDLATGAGGAETVVVPNLLVDNYGSSSSHHGAGSWALPLAVASGTRVAVRSQSTTASQDLFVSVTFTAAGDTAGCAAFVNVGANTGTTRGVSVDPGGTANTKGSYAQLTASTASVAQVILPLVSFGGNSGPSAAQWAVDVATGAGGAETVLLPDLRLGTSGSPARINLRSLTWLTYVAAGTRIAARASCDITDATDRLLDVAALVATAPGGTAHYPSSATGLAYATYPVGPTAAAQQVTSGGTAHTKGSYVQVIASLGFTANYVTVLVVRSTGSSSGIQQFLDVATGAGGAETVVVSNLLIDNQQIGTSHYGTGAFTLPLAVASGTRVAVRTQSVGTVDLWLSVTVAAAGDTPGCQAFVNYGANTSTTRGVTVDPGGTINTKGSYAQLTASTAEVAQVIVPMVSMQGNSTSFAAQWAVDVATGAGGAETVLLPDLRLGSGAITSARLNLRALTFLTYVAAATRIAARASCDITGAADRVLDLAVLVATAPSEPSAAVEYAHTFLRGF